MPSTVGSVKGSAFSSLSPALVLCIRSLTVSVVAA
ncbi:Uncharacterised protein [Bordetella pertussis]|nr:Uncharacterised protein [Bordetella pertussis]